MANKSGVLRRLKCATEGRSRLLRIDPEDKVLVACRQPASNPIKGLSIPFLKSPRHLTAEDGQDCWLSTTTFFRCVHTNSIRVPAFVPTTLHALLLLKPLPR